MATINVPEALGLEHANALYSTLLQALSIDPSQPPQARAEAEALLRAFEIVPNYCDVLMRIIASPDAHDNARLLALLCIQNVVRRHWREKGGGGGGSSHSRFGGGVRLRRDGSTNLAPGEATRIVTEEEKQRVRAFLLHQMQEKNEVMAKNLAHVLAKVVRADWPRKWPDFFPQLIALLHPPRSNEQGAGGGDAGLQTQRVIQSLHRVIKELAGKGLLCDKMAFQNMAQLLFPVAYTDLWRPRMAQLVHGLGLSLSGGGSNDVGVDCAQLAALALQVKTCTKILFCLTTNHAETLPHEAIVTFFQDIKEGLGPLLQAHKTLLLNLHTTTSQHHHHHHHQQQQQQQQQQQNLYQQQQLGDQQQHIGRQQQIVGQQQQQQLSLVISKVLKNLSGIIVVTQKETPMLFRNGLLASYLPFFYEELGSVARDPAAAALLLWDTSDRAPSNAFYLHVIQFFNECIKSPNFRHDVGASEEDSMSDLSQNSLSPRQISFAADEKVPAQWIIEVYQATVGFFGPSRLLAMCELIFEHLLGLRGNDLELWTSAPEDFLLEEQQRHRDDDIRAAAEYLFLSIFDARGNLIAKHTADLLNNYQAQLQTVAAAAAAAATSLTVPPEVLWWDRVYLALGLTTYSLGDHLDLPAWYAHCFLPLLQQLTSPPPSSSSSRPPPILLRRLIYLLACSTNEVPRPIKPQLYQLLAAALDPSNPCTDLVVALIAIEALENFVTDWAFHEQRADLLPALPTILNNLFRVVDASSELGNKTKAFQLIKSLISFMGAPASPSSEKQEGGEQAIKMPPPASYFLQHLGPIITQPLPRLWAQANKGGGREMMMEIGVDVMQILVVLLPLCIGEEDESKGIVQATFHPLILPMLDVATDLSQQDDQGTLSLLEDGLKLCLVTTKHAASYDPQGLGLLFPRLPVILNHGLEHVKAVMSLIEAYILLGGGAFLQQHLPTLCNCLTITIHDVADRGMSYVTKVIELLLVAFPEEGARALMEVQLLPHFLSQCLLYHQHQHSDSNNNSNGADSLLQVTSPQYLAVASAGSSISISASGAPSPPTEMVVVQYLSILLRVYLTAPPVFSHLLQSTGVNVLSLVDLMVPFFDQVGSGGAAGSWRRKLWAMSLLSLLSTPPSSSKGDGATQGSMLMRIEQVLNIYLDVLAEEREALRQQQEGKGDKGGSSSKVRSTGSGHLHYRGDLDEENLLEDLAEGGGGGGGCAWFKWLVENQGERGEGQARKQHPLLAHEVVQQTDLQVYLHHRMEATRLVVGEEAFQAALQTVHPSIIQQLQQPPT